ncbi:hypothetical protein Tco_1192260 [Tanacetum coccineum]
MKLLDTGIIDPITDSPWVSPIHCVPKKGGILLYTLAMSAIIPIQRIPLCHIPDTYDSQSVRCGGGASNRRGVQQKTENQAKMTKLTLKEKDLQNQGQSPKMQSQSNTTEFSSQTERNRRILLEQS